MEQPILSKGLCSYHRSLELPKKHYTYNLNITEKQRKKKKVKSELMKPYWEHHLENMRKTNARCDNCGMALPFGIENVAHIIPKRSHIELMDNLDNCLYLCASFSGGIGCHDKMDRIQTTNKFYLMPCFEKAYQQYLKFKDVITKHSKYVEIFERWETQVDEIQS